MTKANPRKKRNPLVYVALAVFVVAVLFPFYWILITSLKTENDLITLKPFAIPLSLRSYLQVFTERPFGRYLFNSLVVAACTTLLAIAAAEIAAYALARLNFRGKSVILKVVLAVSMFPAIATITPIYVFIKNAGLRNTYAGLIIPYISFALPMAIWFLTIFFRGIPYSLEEAAKIDGAAPFTIFLKIIAPLATPGVFTTAILVFINAWNEYLFALTINTDDNMRTVPVGITMYNGLYTIPWGEIAAAIVVVTVPLIIVVLLFQRRIVGGLAAGAEKG